MLRGSVAVLGAMLVAFGATACAGNKPASSPGGISISTPTDTTPPDLRAAQALGVTLFWHDDTLYRYTGHHWVPSGWTRSKSIYGSQYRALFDNNRFVATVDDHNTFFLYLEPAGTDQWFAVDKLCANKYSVRSCLYVVTSDGRLVTPTEFASEAAAGQQTVPTTTTAAPPVTVTDVETTTITAEPSQPPPPLPSNPTPVGGTGQPSDPAAQAFYQQELLLIQEAQQRAAEVWVEPECNFSYNGCAP
jgi:hypothetical protein